MPKLDLTTIPLTNSTGYPARHAGEVQGRWVRRLAPAAGLTEMGASHVTLKPGAWSSQRHWHDTEDEMVIMLAGEAVLIEDRGRTILHPGDVCAWPGGATNGHHLINESGADCTFIALSAGLRTTAGYSDIDMQFTPEGYSRKDGSAF